MRQSELVNRFYNGAESGVASNMEIAQLNSGATVLKGYGHAVYAYRPPEGRFGVVCFAGWKGASDSTTRHIKMIAQEATHMFDGRPSVSDVTRDPELDVLKGISSNDKDYGGFHDRQDRRKEEV